jgi:hypothetical protein
MEGVVKTVDVYYFSDQTAETRILTDKGEIWFGAVAPVAEKDTVTATGRKGSLFDILKQSHTKSIVDEIVQKEMARNSKTKEEVQKKEVFRATEIVDKTTTYSIPQVGLHLNASLAVLTFFYPIVACVGAIALIFYVNGFTLDKASTAVPASFVVVSLISLIGDQEILNILAWVGGRLSIKVDWHNAANKSALKDGKGINLFLTAVLTLVAAYFKLKG